MYVGLTTLLGHSIFDDGSREAGNEDSGAADTEDAITRPDGEYLEGEALEIMVFVKVILKILIIGLSEGVKLVDVGPRETVKLSLVPGSRKVERSTDIAVDS